jgi:glutamine synthetase
MSLNEIVKQLDSNGDTKVKFAVTDIDGILRGKVINLAKLKEAGRTNIGFCNVVFGWDMADSCYDNTKYTGWHTGYPDAKATIDHDTFRRIPWDNNLPFFIADFSNDAASAICPRSLLKRVSAECNNLGYFPRFAQEFEWFNFKGRNEGEKKYEPISQGMFGYSFIRPAMYSHYFNDLFDYLSQFGILLEGLHTETGPGVYEAAIAYDSILNAADKAVLFKNAVKEIALKHNIVASFMAKWNDNLPGCSGHIHQSLWNDKGENLFYKVDSKYHMSELMEHYLAGLLYCMPQILPMYAPNVNSFKRLREGAWAPTTLSWGFENRTTAVRVIDGHENSSRLELRVPGSDVNPYLAMAASLASGMYGIKHKLTLNEPETIGNAYAEQQKSKLPVNLMEATRIMRESAIAKELFGAPFVDHFTQTREWEWRAFMGAVTDWELNRYFEII